MISSYGWSDLAKANGVDEEEELTVLEMAEEAMSDEEIALADQEEEVLEELDEEALE